MKRSGGTVWAMRALPLTGFTIAVTAARRREELQSLLEQRGARVVAVPAIRLAPLADDSPLHAATKACIDVPPDIVVATTGVGFRGWVEAADGWGLADDLLAALAAAEVLSRGSKARGAVRASGLTDSWTAPSESSTEVLDHLLRRDLTGVRIAVQLHGEPPSDFVETLRAAGADVVALPDYRWVPPHDVAAVERLVELVADCGVDAVVFTSAPAVAAVLSVAAQRGCLAGFLEALRGHVVAVCVGPVTAAPLERHGVPSVQPARSRLGALVREVACQLPQSRSRAVLFDGHRLEVRGHCAVLDGRQVALAPAPYAVLRALADRPGRVLSRQALLPVLPGGGSDEHAVEMAVTRLRVGLGDARLVQTVVKRGYRLACDSPL